jgi:hypothetical protein
MSPDFSDIPDGFALKKQRRKVAKSKRKPTVRGECTIPPPGNAKLRLAKRRDAITASIELHGNNSR